MLENEKVFRMDNQRQTSPPQSWAPYAVILGVGVSLAILSIQLHDTTEEKFELGLAAMDARFEAVHSRFDGVDAKFEAINVKIDSIGDALGRIAISTDSMGERLLHIETDSRTLIDQYLADLRNQFNEIVRTPEGWFIQPADGSALVGIEIKASQ
ncbi:MAG: hypothetical protein OXF33_09100 [Rhodospirillales bacterium]|nr:hypothetical protein [Rhodospirillales bacterium]